MKNTLVIVLLLVSVCVSKQLNGYMVNNAYPEVAKIQKDQENYDASDLAAFFKSNIGTLAQKPSEIGQKLIEKYGKGDLYSPLQMNYMFIVEGLNDMEVRRTQVQNTVPVSFSNERTEGSLLEDIFDILKEDSVVSSVNQFYESDKSRIPFYIYSSSNIFSDYFENYGMTLNVKKTAEVDLYDTTIGKKYSISSNIEQCVNEVFGKTYALRAIEGYIYKTNSFNKLKIDSDNMAEIEEFLKDICGVSKLSKMFKKDVQPSFALFHINSLANLKQKLNQEDFEFVLDVFTFMMKKSQKSFNTRFPGDVLGQVLYVEDSSEIAGDKAGELTPSANLVELMQRQPAPKRRRLSETSYSSTIDAATYSIIAWLSLVLIFALAYIAISLYQMDVGKDTLLYAKFIANDK